MPLLMRLVGQELLKVCELLRVGRAFDRPHGDFLNLRIRLLGLLLQPGKLLGLVLHGAFQCGDLRGHYVLLALQLTTKQFVGRTVLLFEPRGGVGCRLVGRGLQFRREARRTSA